MRGKAIHQRRNDLPLADFRVPSVPILHLKPLRQHTEDLPFHGDAAQVVEASLLVQGGEEDLQTFAKGSLAEILQPRRCLCPL